MDTQYCSICGADTSNPCGCVDEDYTVGAEQYKERLTRDVPLEMLEELVEKQHKNFVQMFNTIPITRLELLDRMLAGQQSIIPFNITYVEWKYLYSQGYCKICRSKCKDVDTHAGHE